MNYRVVLPTVLRKAKKASRITASDCVSIEIPDGRETIRRYFTTMNLGVRYEQLIHEDWNKWNPDILTDQNLRTSTLLRSRGWSRRWLDGLIETRLAELERIPPNADLLETRQYDQDVVRLLVRFCDRRGIREANATKLLYQKRPALIPVLDSQVQLALGVGWTDSGEKLFQAYLDAFRSVADFEGNAGALWNVHRWVVQTPDAVGGVTLSRVRILDILAWMEGYADEYYKLNG